MNLQTFKVGEARYGIVSNGERAIISEPDFCHIVELNNGFVLLGGDNGSRHTLLVKDLLARAEPITSMKDFGHYWGIKPRVKQNYLGLLATMKELGIPTDDMPEWPKRFYE
jgi:hypothetical protein